jgi:hypothetical protein
MVADRLVPGVYFAQSYHGNDMIGRQKVMVP